MDIFIIKKELINNLCIGIGCHIVDGFTSIFEDAVRVNPLHVQDQVKRFLLDIQDWNIDVINNETKRILSFFPSLRKILKTINFINIKSLSLMGRHDVVINDEYIASKTPNVSTFIHRVYIHASKEFFHDESLLNPSCIGTRPRQTQIVHNIIKQVLNECVPIDEMLSKITDDDVLSLSMSKNEGFTDIAESIERLQENDDDEDEEEEDEEELDEEEEQDENDEQEQQQPERPPAAAPAPVEKVPEKQVVKQNDSGIVSTSGTGVQIMLHSSIIDDTDDTTKQNGDYNITFDESTTENMTNDTGNALSSQKRTVPIKRSSVISRSSVVKKKRIKQYTE